MLRIEWCKARARADRWGEECELVKEEMRRVLQFHDWQKNQWLTRATLVPPGLSPDYAEGLVAYAHRQADTRSSMQAICETSWRDVEAYILLSTRSASPSLAPIPEESEVLDSFSHLEESRVAGDPDITAGLSYGMDGLNLADGQEELDATADDSLEGVNTIPHVANESVGSL